MTSSYAAFGPDMLHSPLPFGIQAKWQGSVGYAQGLPTTPIPFGTLTFCRLCGAQSRCASRGILAGSFTESDVPANAPRTNFGWVMAPLQPAPTYIVSFDKFDIVRTRAILHDTDFAALTIQALTSVGYQEPLTLSLRIPGDIDGPNHAVGLQLAARVQPNEALTFSYLITNSGFAGSDSQKLQQTLDKISDATKKALDIVYPAEAAVWEVANDLTQFLNSIFVAQCDGIVAGDKVAFTGAELNQLMPASGSQDPVTRRYTYTSQDGCGRSPIYDVHWTITRQ